jgi:hypothetical protein
MHPESPALRRPLPAAGDPVARVAAGRPQPAPRAGSDPLRSDYGNRETWRRVLAAHVQPLPEAAD